MSIDEHKKSFRGRPRIDSEQVRSRMDRPLLDALDTWIAAQPQPPSRSEAVRRLVAGALAKPEDAGSIRVEDLNARDDG